METPIKKERSQKPSKGTEQQDKLKLSSSTKGNKGEQENYEEEETPAQRAYKPH